MDGSQQGWNASGILGAVAVTLALLFTNLDGYQTHLLSPGGPGDIHEEPPVINYCHGWPACFLVRCSNYSETLGKGHAVPQNLTITGPVGLYSRWPVDSAPVFYFSGAWLAVDVGIFVLLGVGTAFGLQPVDAWLRARLRFSIRAMFILTTIVAIVVASGLWQTVSRLWLQYAALGVILAGVCLSLFAVASLVRARIRLATAPTRSAVPVADGERG